MKVSDLYNVSSNHTREIQDNLMESLLANNVTEVYANRFGRVLMLFDNGNTVEIDPVTYYRSSDIEKSLNKRFVTALFSGHHYKTPRDGVSVPTLIWNSSSAPIATLARYGVKKIIRNGPCTIVFWDDGTKTIVKRAKGSKDDPYYAFCAALAKKYYKNNSQIKKLLDEKTIVQEKKDKRKKK